MILAAVVAAALIVPVSIEHAIPPTHDRSVSAPTWRKAAALHPLINSATECIAPRYRPIALPQAARA